MPHLTALRFAKCARPSRQRVLDCGGKRSATPLSHARDGLIIRSSSSARKRRRRFALPAQSKMFSFHSQRDSNPSAPGWRSAPDRRGAPTLGNRSPNSSTLKELNQIHRRTDSTANHTNHAKIKTEFPFAYLASFAVRLLPLQLLQSCFHFARSPSVVALLQRWAECCNRVAVGARLWQSPAAARSQTHAAK
jgi:hypothetical protein